MTTNTLATNIGQTVSDFKDIKEALTEKSIHVSPGTKTEEYGDLVRRLYTGSYIDEIVEAARIVLLKNNYEGGMLNSQVNAFTHHIKDGEFLFFRSAKINGELSANFNSLENGDSMFQYCTYLTSVTTDFPALVNGRAMFAYCTNLVNFTSDLSELKDGGNMFQGCTNLTTFTSGLNNLENGYRMFHPTDKTVPLTIQSLLHILNSIPDRTGLTSATITFGAGNLSKLTAEQKAIATHKNWILE